VWKKGVVRKYEVKLEDGEASHTLGGDGQRECKSGAPNRTKNIYASKKIDATVVGGRFFLPKRFYKAFFPTFEYSCKN